jgi:hypothetical protein
MNVGMWLAIWVTFVVLVLVQVMKWLFALSAFLRRGGRRPLWATRLAGAGDGGPFRGNARD